MARGPVNILIEARRGASAGQKSAKNQARGTGQACMVVPSRLRETAGDEQVEMARLAALWSNFSEAERVAEISTLDAESIGIDPAPGAAAPDNDNVERNDGDADAGAPEWFDFADDEWPVRPDVIHRFLHNHTCHRSQGTAGIARKASFIREAERGILVVTDNTPDSAVYVHRHPCTELHPGLCATRDSEIYERALLLVANLMAALDTRFLHRYFCFFDATQEDDIAF